MAVSERVSETIALGSPRPKGGRLCRARRAARVSSVALARGEGPQAGAVKEGYGVAIIGLA